MLCPVCNNSEMWDNRGKKTNPKAPDYKCKDKSCTGVIWPKKDSEASNAISGPSNHRQVGSGGDNSLDLCHIASEVISAEIRAGIKVEQPFKRVIDGVKYMKSELSSLYKPKEDPKPIQDVPEVDIDEPATDPIPTDKDCPF